MKLNIFWFRRDLRLEDNTALNFALDYGLPVLALFIFDINITEELPEEDSRISFIYDTLSALNNELQKSGSSICIRKGDPIEIWNELTVTFDINAVYLNKDYEPYAIQRDNSVEDFLRKKQISLLRYKDQAIFEDCEVLKSDNKPYTIFTPYKNRWLQKLKLELPFKSIAVSDAEKRFYWNHFEFPSLEELGFRKSTLKVRPYNLSVIENYDRYRDFPSADKTSYLGPYLRFGNVSIRRIVLEALNKNSVFLNELIWREFFMQILSSFPKVVTGNFRSKYDNIQWRNNEKEFELWCNGETGYPLVDAGMRQLNTTGYMHNRVRMITAGFLCKHLLIDWRWGEAYFAEKLLDYELSSNNGNWQWAAGTGCDAAPYFRIFNPDTQLQKFDRNKEYVKKWIEELDKPSYPKRMVDHDFARQRVISVYKSGLKF